MKAKAQMSIMFPVGTSMGGALILIMTFWTLSECREVRAPCPEAAELIRSALLRPWGAPCYLRVLAVRGLLDPCALVMG